MGALPHAACCYFALPVAAASDTVSGASCCRMAAIESIANCFWKWRSSGYASMAMGVAGLEML